MRGGALSDPILQLGAALALLGCAVGAVPADEGPFRSASGELEVWFPSPAFGRGENRVELCVAARDDGEPALGLTMEMVPYMPSMGHGSSGPSPSLELGDGCYAFEGVVLSMPGTWELRTKIEGGFEDTVTLRLSVR